MRDGRGIGGRRHGSGQSGSLIRILESFGPAWQQHRVLAVIAEAIVGSYPHKPAAVMTQSNSIAPSASTARQPINVEFAEFW
jgi:hypothetical protein